MNWNQQTATCPRGHTIGSGVVILERGVLWCVQCERINEQYWTQTETRHANEV